MNVVHASALSGLVLWFPLLFADAGPDAGSTWTLKEVAATVAASSTWENGPVVLIASPHPFSIQRYWKAWMRYTAADTALAMTNK